MAEKKEAQVAALGPEALQAVKAFYDYDPGIPLDARIVERADDGKTVRDKVTFRGVRGFWVPGYLEIPQDGAAPHPCVLLLHGWSWSKARCWQLPRCRRGDASSVSMSSTIPCRMCW